MQRSLITRVLASLAALLTPFAVAHAQDEPAAEQQPEYRYAVVETSLGDMVVRLNQRRAPVSVANFVQYAEEDAYNGTIFHRVIPGFVIQAGGYDADLDRQPSNKRAGITNEWRNGLKNDRGTIAMARLGGQPNSATSEFYFNLGDNPSLDRAQRDGAGYAVFGRIIDGLATMDEIGQVQTGTRELGGFRGSMPDVPVEPVIINDVRIVEASEVQEAIDSYTERIEAAELARIEEMQAQIKEGIDFVEAQGIDISNAVFDEETSLWYVDVVEGNGPQVGQAGFINMHYTGWLPDGTQFDTSRDNDVPVRFQIFRTIEGFKQAVGGMKVGGWRYIVVPPELGYGNRQAGAIPPNSVLVFEVELFSDEYRAQAMAVAAEQQRVEAFDYVQREFGLDAEDGETIVEGLWVANTTPANPDAEKEAEPTSTLRVHYTGWLTDGTKFDSSHDRGEPAEFPLNRVISGWTQGMTGAKAGETRILVIAPQLAYGERATRTIPANSTLVFEVEVLEVDPQPEPVPSLPDPNPNAQPEEAGDDGNADQDAGGDGSGEPEPDAEPQPEGGNAE